MGKIIRKVIAILLAVTAVILICIPASDASATTQKGDFVLDGSTLVSYVGEDADVTLPNTITKVGKDAFSGNKILRKIVIPDSVKTIDYAAFENCVNLQTAKIGESVRTIGSSAFSGCKNLSSCNIPAKCEDMGSGVFAGCTSLAEVSISPSNIYYTCVDGVIYTRDGSKLIQYLPGRTSSAFTMPATVQSIGEYSFWGSDSLASVTVSKGVKEIPEYAFSNCNSLGKVILPTSVESLMAYSFADCPNLRSVAIPDSVGYIDEKAFNLSNGATIQFVDPGGLPTKEVPVAAVAEATGSTGTVAAATQASLGAAGASNAQAATPVPTPTVNPNAQDRPDGYTASYSGQSNWIDVINDRDFANNIISGELGSSMIVGGNAVMLMSPDMPVRSYDMDDAENEDLMALSGGNTTDKSDVFNTIDGVLASYNGNEESVKIPQNISSIGNRAFYGNQNVKSVSIPDGVNSIDDFAFARTNLESVSIPDSVTNIDYAAFYHCENLANVSIPTSVDNIELGAFDGTKWLNDWKVNNDGNSFLTVGNGILLAYKGEGGNISLPTNVKTIAAGCFSGNTAITGVNIPEGVGRIGEDAFNGCINLTAVTLPEGLRTIEDRAFCDTGIDAVTVPDSVETIGLGAFDTTGNMSPLTTVLFMGDNVPNVSYKDTATRLSARNLRTDALNGVENVIVQADCNLDSGTLFNPKYYGFHGQVYCISPDSTDTLGTLSLLKTTKRPDVSGTVTIDSNVPIADENYMMNGVKEHAFDDYLNYEEWCDTKPTSVNVVGNKSSDLNSLLNKITSAIDGEGSSIPSGINVVLEGSEFASKNASASLTDSDESFTLVISEDSSYESSLKNGLYNCYGDGVGVLMVPLDISLYDKTGTVLIHKLGDSKLDVTMPVPSRFNDTSSLKVASLDENGSLTELPTSVSGDSISFVANHCSAFAIYTKNETTMIPDEDIEDTDMSEDDIALPQDVQGDINDDSFDDNVAVVIQSVDADSANANHALNGGIINTLNKKVYNIEARWFVIVILLATAAILFLYKPSASRRKS